MSNVRGTIVWVAAIIAAVILAGSITAARADTPRRSAAVVGEEFAIDGKPFQNVFGEFQYQRIPGAYWQDRLRKARARGVNTIATAPMVSAAVSAVAVRAFAFDDIRYDFASALPLGGLPAHDHLAFDPVQRVAALERSTTRPRNGSAAGRTTLSEIAHPLPTLPPKKMAWVAGSCAGCKGADNSHYHTANQPLVGFDAIKFTMSPRVDTAPNDYYYWAYETGFMNRQQFYFGLQPNGQFGKTALFSVFGNGTSSNSRYRYCKAGADSGSGTSCHIPYNWKLDHFYDFTVTLVGKSRTSEEWQGNVYDDNTGTKTFIGDIFVPASAGYIDLNRGGAFEEYFEYGSYPCPREPYTSILFLTPTGYWHGQPSTSAYANLNANSGCNVKFYTDGATYAYLDNGH